MELLVARMASFGSTFLPKGRWGGMASNVEHDAQGRGAVHDGYACHYSFGDVKILVFSGSNCQGDFLDEWKGNCGGGWGAGWVFRVPFVKLWGDCGGWGRLAIPRVG